MKEKFGIMSIVMLLLCSGFVFADPVGIPNYDQECMDNCNGLKAIAKWEDGNVQKYMAGYAVNVTGDGESANWTSSPGAECLVSQEGSNTYTHIGGTSGTVVKTGKQEIGHITLCGRSQNQIPEFTAVAAGIALLGSGAAFIALRKKR